MSFKIGDKVQNSMGSSQHFKGIVVGFYSNHILVRITEGKKALIVQGYVGMPLSLQEYAIKLDGSRY